MYIAPKCPICDEELTWDFEDDYDIGDDFVILSCHGNCPKCKKYFKWTETYTYKCYDDLEEDE